MNSVYVKPDYDLDLLTEKGVHPYDYMNSLSKFNDTCHQHKAFAANCLKKKPVRKIMTERWRHLITLIWKIWETTAICI